MAAPETDPTNPHDLAVDAVQDIQNLATILAHAGANPDAVAKLTEMAKVLGDVAKQLAASPLPPPQGQNPEQAMAHHAGTMAAATANLHQAMMASAQQRQQPEQGGGMMGR